MAVMRAVGFMAQANAEIRAAQQRHEIDTARRWRLGRPMRVIDELINDLEMLNLKRVYRVPLSYESRLVRLRVILDDAGVPSGELAEVRTRIRIVRLMDHLYAIQELMLAGDQPLQYASRRGDAITG